jgi:hypothetical protein
MQTKRKRCVTLLVITTTTNNPAYTRKSRTIFSLYCKIYSKRKIFHSNQLVKEIQKNDDQRFEHSNRFYSVILKTTEQLIQHELKTI